MRAAEHIMIKTLRWLVLALLLHSLAIAQLSGSAYRKSGIINRNQTLTAFGNWGVIGQPPDSGSRGAWKFSTNGYIGDMSILIGIELPIKDYNNDGKPDTVHSVVTCPVLRPTPIRDEDPTTGVPWTFQPIDGYSNPTQQSPAIRSKSQTWPDVWPDHPEWGAGKWNGLRGPDSLSGDDESYFRIDDRNDERFNIASNNSRGIVFIPDTNNPARRGQGITVGVRYIQSADPRFQDIFFRAYDITNEGTADYSKVVFGTLTGTYIGVTTTENYSEYANDVSVYFPSSDFILSWNDPENKVMDPFWQGPVGKFGEAFIETPSGNHIASYDGFSPSNTLSLGNDENLWGRLTPGRYDHPANIINDTVAISGNDMDYVFGSNYFAIRSGETKRVVSLIAYGYAKEEIKRKILLANALWNSDFHPDAVFSSASITNFSNHTFLSGQQSIQWATVRSGGSVSIWYSPDAGSSWFPVAVNFPNTGSIAWDTENYPDGAFGLLRIVAFDTTGRLYAFHETGYFTVNNQANGVPFVRITDTTLASGATVTQPAISLPILIGDPEWDSVGVTFSYRTGPGSPFSPFESYTAPSDTSMQIHIVPLLNLPNSTFLQLKVVVTDGMGSWSDSTAPFDKESARPFFPIDRVQFRGPAQVPINVLVKDSASLRSDLFVVTFNDTAYAGPKTYSVRDSTRQAWLVSNAPFYPMLETAPFDGLTLNAPDFVTIPDTARIRWNRAPAGATWQNSMHLLYTHGLNGTGIYTGYRQPFDYSIVFENGIVDTSAPYPLYGISPVSVNFRIYNMQTHEKIKEWVYANGSSVEIVFLEKIYGLEHQTWDIQMMSAPADSFPHSGDTLYLYTKKGLSTHDTLTIEGLTLSVPPVKGVPTSFALHQNYPNPFNPSTTIAYDIAGSGTGYVKLTVYDLLGREVAVLVNEKKPPGFYNVTWNARGKASGVYFYRLQAGSSVDTKKLLLLR